jgi:hypothetical protein
MISGFLLTLQPIRDHTQGDRLNLRLGSCLVAP